MKEAAPEICVGTFHATYAVLKAEKLLKKAGIAVKMIPVPRQISSNCGISIRFDCAALARVREEITPLAADMEGLFKLAGDGKYRRV